MTSQNSRFRWLLLVAVFVLINSAGCDGTKVEKISVPRVNDPLVQARVFLKRYASGEPLGSEAALFQSTASDVKRSNKIAGDILELGFEAILKAAPEKRSAIAAELLVKLASE